VLPEPVATDGERVRFQREADALARLNHPNIAAIYGLERSDGTAALFIELVVGPRWRTTSRWNPFPVDDVLPIARYLPDTASRNAAISWPLRTSRTFPTRTG
jgi:serine/threonine protein kinase